jgi:hypothetical protein
VALSKAREGRHEIAIYKVVGCMIKNDGIIEYQCWFCGNGIEFSDTLALKIISTSLWYDTEGSQEIYVHSKCAEIHMKGSQMSLEIDYIQDNIENHNKS